MTPLPERINRLDATGTTTSGGAGRPKPAASSVVSTTRCGETRRTTRCGCSRLLPPDVYERAMADIDVARRLRSRLRRGSTRHARAADLVREPVSRAAGQVDRLLLRRVRAAPVAADLRRRARRAGRRSLQGSERPGRAAHRRRVHVPAGLLPPGPLVGRLAAGDLREAELDGRADRAGDDRRREAVHHRGAARQPHGARGGVARARRPRHAVSARHGSRGERAVGSRAVGAPLRRRSRDARAAGDHPRHRRRARAQGDGHLDRRSITSTKDMPRSSSCSASATCARRDATFEDALDEVRRTTVFTTHTPVAAGHDAFPFHLVETHLAGAWGDLGAYRERFLALGHYDNGGGPMFNMTALALRTSGAVNGVSQLHGEVTKQMWQPIWPGVPLESLPVRSITNGVHVPTWMSSEIGALLERHLGPDWLERPRRPDVCRSRAGHSGRGAVGGAPVAARVPLQLHPRARADRGGRRSTSAAARVVAAGTMFDHNTLTIGFARRFTGYKRPELIFLDSDRLARILTTHGRAVQIVFAGKAHPADDIGKHHLQRIYRRALDPKFGGRIALRRRLRPARRPLPGPGVRRLAEQPAQAARSQRHERDEGGHQRHAAHVDRRWLVGGGVYRQQRLAHRGPGRPERSRRAGLGRRAGDLRPDRTAARADLLRSRRTGIPRRWLQIVKQSIRTVLPRFSARRMVKEYVREMYLPAVRRETVAR